MICILFMSSLYQSRYSAPAEIQRAQRSGRGIIGSVKTRTIFPGNLPEARQTLASLTKCEPDEPLLLAVIHEETPADPQLMQELMELQLSSRNIYVLFGTKEDFVNPAAASRQELLTEGPGRDDLPEPLTPPADQPRSPAGKEDQS